jgi:hypothetical protein
LEFTKQLVDVAGQDGDCLTECPIPAVARKENKMTLPHQQAERRVIQAVIAIDTVEVKHLSVERDRCLHASAPDVGNNSHVISRVGSSAERSRLTGPRPTNVDVRNRAARGSGDAEPLLLTGYEGMKQRETTIPEQGNTRIPEALDRLIELYTATDKPDEVKKWQAERAKYSPDPGK